jgi:hypothetical protein
LFCCGEVFAILLDLFSLLEGKHKEGRKRLNKHPSRNYKDFETIFQLTGTKIMNFINNKKLLLVRAKTHQSCFGKRGPKEKKGQNMKR